MRLSQLNPGFCRAAAAIIVSLVLQADASAASNEKTVYAFCSVPNCTDGSYPESGVIFDKTGNLYGTANAGGVGFGSVFSLTPDSTGNWTESTIYTFTSLADGDGPNNLVFGNAGTLYGTTIYGGGAGNCSNGGCGTVFKLALVNGVWTKKVLYRFSGGNDGGVPFSGVIRDKAGNLYGTTSEGGTRGAGTVFELTHSQKGWTERVIHNFTGGSDGGKPFSGLILDTLGHLLGTTTQGGRSNLGVVFELTLATQGWKETVLHSFAGNGQDGADPYTGNLMLDRAGNLYGTTAGGGMNGLGTVFQLTRSKSGVKERVLYSFFGTSDGNAPYTGVIIDTAGNLYGTTSIGGSGGDGTIFTLRNTGSAWNITVLYGFSGSDGSEPIGNLVFDVAGNIYGTAALGGANHTGTGNVFEITP
jgi:uncharacterized repeat protein (TIGR03803 family)